MVPIVLAEPIACAPNGQTIKSSVPVVKATVVHNRRNSFKNSKRSSFNSINSSSSSLYASSSRRLLQKQQKQTSVWSNLKTAVSCPAALTFYAAVILLTVLVVLVPQMKCFNVHYDYQNNNHNHNNNHYNMNIPGQPSSSSNHNSHNNNHTYENSNNNNNHVNSPTASPIDKTATVTRSAPFQVSTDATGHCIAPFTPDCPDPSTRFIDVTASVQAGATVHFDISQIDQRKIHVTTIDRNGKATYQQPEYYKNNHPSCSQQ